MQVVRKVVNANMASISDRFRAAASFSQPIGTWNVGRVKDFALVCSVESSGNLFVIA